MTEISHIFTSQDQKYLFGADFRGKLFIWLLKDLLVQQISFDSAYSKLSSVFRPIASVKLFQDQYFRSQIYDGKHLVVFSGKQLFILDFQTIEKLLELGVSDTQTISIDMREKLHLIYEFTENQSLEITDLHTSPGLVSSEEIIITTNLGLLLQYSFKTKTIVNQVDTKNDPILLNNVMIGAINPILCGVIDGERIITGSKAGLIQIWNFNQEQKIVETLGFKSVDSQTSQYFLPSVNALCLAEGRRDTLISGHDYHLILWNMVLNQIKYVTQRPTVIYKIISVSPERFMELGEDDEIRVFDYEGQIISQFESGIQIPVWMEKYQSVQTVPTY